ncbi:sensor histidine kinase [Serratia proteamaculans]|uniref:histidine kinase n=1 Tax=Serratia proteamaculans TaxID=28151 RepID=A0A5Q2V3K2_SERPR|nr:ATP-binding protein [Serratia proteamaculans]QGH59967.1 sensor histidine kinase [Serratia proteamaculans]
MIKIIGWLVLVLLSSGGLTAYFLQQQYEEKSASFRILYRDVTIKLSQHDAIIPLLPASQYSREVQRIFPQIIHWRSHTGIEPRRLIVVESKGRYWLNIDNQSLLIDLNRLMGDLIGENSFRHLTLHWNNQLLYTQGAVQAPYYWQWDKVIASQSQPFVLSAGDNPDWSALPWPVILSPALFWGLVLYLINQYRTNRRRRDIDALRTHYAEITRLNTLGELTAGIVHELNQPLTAILSYNQTALRLIRQKHTEQLPQLLEAAVVQIKRTDSLLQQFRQKLTSERVDYQPVALAGLWTRVVMLLDNEIRSKKVKIYTRIPDDLPALFAPPLWIEQILHNIASNAIQAQENNVTGTAWISLEASVIDEGISLTLTDGGPGLTEQALQQVFMPFFTTRPQGIGLGMALTDTLIQRLNGTIEASNISGKGACFRLWLPIPSQERE